MDNPIQQLNQYITESSPNLQLMTAKEAAEVLKVDPSHVRRMAREGKIPFVKFGKSIRIRQIDLEKFVQEKWHE